MRYNADIAHCSGYLCPLADKCYRHNLLLMWDKMKEKPYANFVASKYDESVKGCQLFLPIGNNK